MLCCRWCAPVLSGVSSSDSAVKLWTNEMAFHLKCLSRNVTESIEMGTYHVFMGIIILEDGLWKL